MDTQQRSVAKTISWRMVATLITGLVTLALTGRLDFAVTVGLGDTFVKIFLYYAHERIWSRIRFGVAKPPEYQI